MSQRTSSETLPVKNRDSSSDRKPLEAESSAWLISEAPERPRGISLQNTGILASDDIVEQYYCENGVCESASAIFRESVSFSSGDFEVRVVGGSIGAPFCGFPCQNFCVLWAGKG
jgi:hypothetical protein